MTLILCIGLYFGFGLLIADVLVQDDPSLNFRSTAGFVLSAIPYWFILCCIVPFYLPYYIYKNAKDKKFI